MRKVEIFVPRDGHGLIEANSSLVVIPGLRRHLLILSHHLVCGLAGATISEAHSDENHVVLQRVDLGLEVLNAGEVGLSQRRSVMQGEIRLRDRIDSEGAA